MILQYTFIMSNIMNFINYIITTLKQFDKCNKLKSCQDIYVGASCIGNKPFPQ